MATNPVKAKKQSKTLRQATSDKVNIKKRSLKTPVRKVTGPISKAKSVVSRSFLGKIGRFLTPKYFSNSWKELRQVSWPDRRQTAKLTFAVIIFAIVFGIIIAIVDYGLDKLFREILLK